MQTEKWSEAKMSTIERKAELETKAEELRAEMRESQLHTFREESRNRCAFKPVFPHFQLMICFTTRFEIFKRCSDECLAHAENYGLSYCAHCLKLHATMHVTPQCQPQKAAHVGCCKLRPVKV